MKSNNYKIKEISLFNIHDNKVNIFLDILNDSTNSELNEWISLFLKKKILLIIGEKYTYGINFRYNSTLGCPFFIKEIISSDPTNCILGGCNPKIGLIVFNIFSRALSCINTIDNIKNQIDVSAEDFELIDGLVVRDLQSSLTANNTNEKLKELEKLKRELEQQISRILSLSISPNNDKLYEFYNALYPMVPEILIKQFELIQQ